MLLSSVTRSGRSRVTAATAARASSTSITVAAGWLARIILRSVIRETRLSSTITTLGGRPVMPRRCCTTSAADCGRWNMKP